MKTHPTYQTLIEKFQPDDNCYETEDSETSKFYAGKNVFITGGTGFLGKLMVEKLLRACPQVKSIYLLVRSKKGKDVQTRIDEIFSDMLFERLSKVQPKFRQKIVLVAGDVCLPGLGISIEDKQTIIDKVSVFIHSAATVRFDEKLHTAVGINIKGTIEMLELAKQAKQIDAFVYISTAYSHCNREDIDEVVYDVPYDVDLIIKISDAIPSEILDKITPDLIGDWPNTYTFTKAMAEICVKNSAAYFPTCIVRPCIVASTYKEPVKNWINNYYGATGVAVGIAIGILRTLLMDEWKVSEMVPADFVVNCILVATQKTAVERKPEVQVYNFVTSNQNQITWHEFIRLSQKHGHVAPSLNWIWVKIFIMTTNRYLYKIYTILLHIIPALLIDSSLFIFGRKPQMMKAYKRIHKFSEMVSHFITKNWTFKNHNTQDLFDALSPAEKKLFCFDMSKFDWDDYFLFFVYFGMRVFLVKEDMSTIAQAKRKYFILRVANTVVMILSIAIVLMVLYTIMMYIFK